MNELHMMVTVRRAQWTLINEMASFGMLSAENEAKRERTQVGHILL